MSETQDFFLATDFRQILSSEFARRRLRRRRYSWRSFARDLEINPATLLGTMSGHHGISAKIAEKIADKLTLTGRKRKFFIDLVESQHARSRYDKEAAIARLSQLPLPNDLLEPSKFDMIAKWYYPAVLELITLPASPLNKNKIASRLCITEEQVKLAIDCLIKAKAIEKTNLGYHRSRRYLKVAPISPSKTVREFHKQILGLAAEEIELQPMDKRKFSSSVLSFDQSKIKQAMEWIDRMEQEFVAKFGTHKSSNTVYSFSLQLFQLDRGQA